MLINRIQFLQSIGRFNSEAPGEKAELKKVTLVYADNGQGKTTLSAVLRSLASNDPLPIQERRRLGSEHPPQVVLKCQDVPNCVMFNNDAWNNNLENLKIFDDRFIDENVYSGLDVASSHRQNLHQLILGEQGVGLNSKLQNLVCQIRNHNENLRSYDERIPIQKRFDLSVKDFCNLSEVPELDSDIASKERELQAAQNQAVVLSKPILSTIGLPTFNIQEILDILGKELADLNVAAADKVQAHIQALGEDGEPWVAEGVQKAVQRGDGTCPYCGQNMEAADLVSHYQAYFSQEYTQLKQNVNHLKETIEQVHADGIQVEFERSVRTLLQSRQSWSNYCDVPEIEIDSEGIVNTWSRARTAVARQLHKKQIAPLESQTLNQSTLDAVNAYQLQKQVIEEMNNKLCEANNVINQVKQQVETADIGKIKTTLSKLNATKFRFCKAIAPLCADYLTEQRGKKDTETERDEARTQLDRYQTDVFPRIQDGVNRYLKRFHAGFTVKGLSPSRIGNGSGSTCTYSVVVNDISVAVKNNNSKDKPSFRSTLSAGDRNTLALALFFSSLEHNPNLADTVVVIDDPISSLDNHRQSTTGQEIRKLSQKAKQAIVLSHSKHFLCDIWNDLDRKHECATLEITANGSNRNESTIQHWDASRVSLTEHDHRFDLLQKYADSNGTQGDLQEVGAAIRFYLEGYLRAACPSQFPPGKSIGQFIQECRDQLNRENKSISWKTLEELNDIRKYANKFHHNSASHEQSRQELLGFVRRTLSLTKPKLVPELN